jgi:hypothetical protein
MNSDLRPWILFWLSRLSHDLEIRLLPSRKQLWSRDAEEIARTVDAALERKEHIYFGILGRKGKVGTKEAVKEAHCLWADIDFKDLAEGQGEADGIVATFDHTPSLQINSGGGYHLYWFLETPTTDLARVERSLKGLAKRLKADIKAAEVSRILRAPGTLNWKYDPPRRVEIVSFNPDNLYALDDFSQWEPKEEEPRPAPANGEFEERFDLKAYLKHYHVQLSRIKKHETSTFYCLKRCLFEEGHTVNKGEDNQAAIGQQESGMLFYQCFHISCTEKTWTDVREKISGKDSLAPFVTRDLKALIGNYVQRATGQFSIGALTGWLDIKTMQEREIATVVIEELENARVIVRTGNKHGVYRPVDNNPRIMRIGGPKKDLLKITLPLELHTLVKLYPKNVILVAGEKDAGKSAFSFNAAYMNKDVMAARYINSEMGEEELNDRLELFGYPMEQWEKITWIEQSSKFEDVIDPDGFNIIDFLEIGADAYAVVEDIKRVFDRLHKGLLLIVMQKRSYKDFAVGGEGTLEKARLAINLTKGGVCRITVAKNWTGKIRNPRGYECEYKIFSGGRMEMTPKGWYNPDIEEAIAPKSKKKLNIVTKKGTDGISTFDDAFVHEE